LRSATQIAGFKPLAAKEVVLLHDIAIAQYGGAIGLRDRALLDGAIGRAEFRLAYGPFEPGSLESKVDATVAVASGIVSSHPFVDGNKRTALTIIRSLLRLNNIEFAPPRGEVPDAMVKLASGDWSEEVFRGWVLKHSTPRAAPSSTPSKTLES
jgi:death on curing protein